MAPYRVVPPPHHPSRPPSRGAGRESNRNSMNGSGSNRNSMNGSGSNRNVGAKRPVRDSTVVSTNNHVVRSKRNLETSAPSTPQLLPQAPIDGPWQRAKDEWKDPNSWFSIDDCGRLIDVPHTFGGSQTIYKWILWAIMMASLVYLWSTADNSWFLGDLDHWAMLAAVIYQTLSLGNGHFHPPQPATADGQVNLYVKIFWILFEVAAHLELLTCVMFWAVVFPQNYETIDIDYGLFALHGVILVGVWVDGMVLNHIPVRVKHYFFVLIVDSVYGLWTIIHAIAGWENGNTNNDEGDNPEANSSDAIYVVFDWNDQTVQSVFLMIAVLTVLVPVLFTFQYLMSLYSFPCIWNGSKSRRCIEFDMGATNRNINTHITYSPTAAKGPGGGGRGTSRPTSPAPVAPVVKNPLPAAKSINNSNISETSRTSSRREGRPMSPVANVPSVLDSGARRSKRPSDNHTVASALTTPSDIEAPPQRKSSRPKSPFPSASRPKSPFPSVSRPKSPFTIPGVAKKNSKDGAGRPKEKKEMSVMDIA